MPAITSRDGTFANVTPEGSLQTIPGPVGPDGQPALSQAAATLSTNALLLFLIAQVQLTNRINVAAAKDRGTSFSDEILSALNKQIV